MLKSLCYISNEVDKLPTDGKAEVEESSVNKKKVEESWHVSIEPMNIIHKSISYSKKKKKFGQKGC